MFGSTFVSSGILSSIPSGSMDVMGGHGIGGGVAAGSIAGIVPMIPGIDVAGRSFPWPVGGVLRNLFIRLAGAQPVSGTLVFEIWDYTTGMGTGVIVTVPAGGGAGTYFNTLNTYVHTAGNLIYLKITNNATSASAAIGGCAWSIIYGLI